MSLPPPATTRNSIGSSAASSGSTILAAVGHPHRELDRQLPDLAPAAPPCCRVEPLAGWHIPLLSDPAFLPLHPLLQRAVLLGVPDQLLRWLRNQPSLGPQVLVAFEQSLPVGLIVTRRLNRSGSCWQIQHLRLASPSSRRRVAAALLREALQRACEARSWIATAASLDTDRLAVLREQGFQPLRTDRLWRWPEAGTPTDPSAVPTTASLPGAPAVSPSAGGQDPSALQLRSLSRRTAALFWHLEQAACPAHLRQLLDRRVEDLRDQSGCRGWMLFDPLHDQAVASVRWLGPHASGGHDVKLTVHPGWQHLHGAPTARLLLQAQQTLGREAPLWFGCDIAQEACQRWLHTSGAEPRGERVLMARSVWRRQVLQAPAQQAARRLEAMLEQWQPKRRPLPTPVGPR